MLWLVERLFVRGGGLGSACALALATAVAIGGGRPGTQVHVLVAAGLYVLLRAALARKSPVQRLHPLGPALGGLLVGAARSSTTSPPPPSR
jgi:hypothetical protein